MSAEQDTAAKSGKKLSALLVLGGVIIIGGGYLLLTWLSPKTAHRSRQSISTARQQAAGGPWWSHSTTGIYCVLTMSAGPQKHYVITRRSSPVCPGDWILITERIKVGILSLLTRPRVLVNHQRPLRQIKQPGKNSGKRYKNCLPASTHSILTPAPGSGGCNVGCHWCSRDKLTRLTTRYRHITTTTSAGGQSGNPGSSYRDTADTGTDPRTCLH